MNEPEEIRFSMGQKGKRSVKIRGGEIWQWLSEEKFGE